MTSLPKGVRIAVSPLSWTNDVLEDLGADISLETCLTDAAEVGYEGIELGRKFPRDQTRLQPILNAHSLALASGWHSGELAERSVHDEIAAVAPHASLLRSMGCDVLVYGEVAMMAPGDALGAPMSQRIVMPKHEITAYAARLTEFGKSIFGEYGLRLAYHHHLMMVAETFDEISTIFDVAGPDCGLLLDTGHAAAAGFDYNRLIERFGDRINHIHLKDVRSNRLATLRSADASFNTGVRGGMFTVPGDGDIDFTPLADFVKNSGYCGWMVVEAEQDPVIAPPRPAVTHAFTHINKTFAGARHD